MTSSEGDQEAEIATEEIAETGKGAEVKKEGEVEIENMRKIGNIQIKVEDKEVHLVIENTEESDKATLIH
jgi:hypothetical protein